MADRERDLERLLTFVDAVVAIAITLLVLPLTEVGDSVQDHDVGALLRERGDDLFSFFLSFAVIAQLWLAQHALVSSLIRQTPAVVRLLILWTLTVVFLPFPTALVTATGNNSVLVKMLYIGTMAVNAALLTLLARVIGRDRTLRDTDAEPGSVQAAATTVAFLIALVVSITVPAFGYWPLLLLFLSGSVGERLARSRARRGGTH